MPTFKSVHAISDADPDALPVRELGPAIDFYTSVLGFAVVSRDTTAAVLTRDGVRIGLTRQPDHDPLRAGSCYIEVDDVEAARRELDGSGAKPGTIKMQQHDGKDFRVFFVRECDILESHDGYCFCFGQPA